MKKTSLIAFAEEAVKISEKGSYISASGKQVSIAKEQRQSVENSILYTPEDFKGLFEKRDTLIQDKTPYDTVLEVNNETVLEAIARISTEVPNKKIFVLNFASAKNPGGGFLNGAKAQEESIARSSGVYPSLIKHFKMYEINRGLSSCLYTDYMIYSPLVPVFRNDEGKLLDIPLQASILTSPAVNAGVVRRQGTQKEIDAINDTMLARTEKVLSVALVNGYEHLILGAWGCGVFQNIPMDIANFFKFHLLENPTFKGMFKKVAFAVYDMPYGNSIHAFQKVFG
jgi:uncharacterized protein (TIGR02452 family)